MKAKRMRGPSTGAQAHSRTACLHHKLSTDGQEPKLWLLPSWKDLRKGCEWDKQGETKQPDMLDTWSGDSCSQSASSCFMGAKWGVEGAWRKLAVTPHGDVIRGRKLHLNSSSSSSASHRDVGERSQPLTVVFASSSPPPRPRNRREQTYDEKEGGTVNTGSKKKGRKRKNNREGKEGHYVRKQQQVRRKKETLKEQRINRKERKEKDNKLNKKERERNMEERQNSVSARSCTLSLGRSRTRFWFGDPPELSSVQQNSPESCRIQRRSQTGCAGPLWEDWRCSWGFGERRGEGPRAKGVGGCF